MVRYSEASRMRTSTMQFLYQPAGLLMAWSAMMLNSLLEGWLQGRGLSPQLGRTRGRSQHWSRFGDFISRQSKIGTRCI